MAPFAVAAICIVFLLNQLEAGALSAIPQQMSQLTSGQLCGALLATLVSFWAVGRYDVVTHRALGTSISTRRGQTSGTSAIALSQTLGFGVFTAAIARWRLLPELSLPQALRVSAFVSLSFILALAVICALASLVFPMPSWVALPAALILLSTVVLLLISLLKPDHRLGRFTVHLPSLTTCRAIFGWTLIDTCAAGVALYLLLPDGTDLTLGVVLPAYLLALGAGLISGAPGGVGPFELALLSALPQDAAPEVLAAAVTFRLIYFALPAVLAGLMLIRPLPAPVAASPPRSTPRPTGRRPAELGVLRQNGGSITVLDHSISALWPTPQTLCQMFDPITGAPETALKDLQNAARHRNKVPVLYKCSARSALAARKAGWQVRHVADEAIVSPSTFDPSARACRDLRRKMRQASRAQITVEPAGPLLPLAAMERIDTQWQSEKGGARGGSMGRFGPDYVAHQQVYLAYQNGRLVGYISLHTTPQEWCLDLMRHATDAPNGTMHMLLAQAIADADHQKVQRVSLACVPACLPPRGDLTARILTRLTPFSATNGLRRFKAGFAPSWERRYVAAPAPLSLALALFDITRSIHRPPALEKTNKAHKEDEECEVAL